LTRLFLLRELVKRDFQSRYAGSWLGVLWPFVQPAWQLLLFSFVFSTVLRISPTGAHTDRFWVFLFSGLLPWLGVQEGLTRGSTAITENANFVKKLQFPSEIIVCAAVITAFVHQLIAGTVFLALLIALRELSWRTLPWLLLAALLQLELTFGLALLLAALQVYFRDLAQIVGMVLAGWFYLTPIVYPLAIVPPSFRRWIELNPLTGLVELYRRALLGGDGTATGAQLAALAIFATALLAGGWWIFHRLRQGFADEL
jgi:homopolymeric O-antigen transport system permease protein